MNTIVLKSGAPKTISAQELHTGQYAVVYTGSGTSVIAVKTLNGLVGLDGHNTWASTPDHQCTPLEQGEVITITAGEQI